MTLNPDNVPPVLRTAIPFAEKWGIGDDYERENLIAEASPTEWRKIVASLDDVDNSVLAQWLLQKSKEQPLSKEFLAFTNLTMAVDSARLKLKRSTKDETKLE